MNRTLDAHKLQVLAGILPAEDLYEKGTFNKSFTPEYRKFLAESKLIQEEENVQEKYEIIIESNSPSDLDNVINVLEASEDYSEVGFDIYDDGKVYFGVFYEGAQADEYVSELYKILIDAMKLNVSITTQPIYE